MPQPRFRTLFLLATLLGAAPGAPAWAADPDASTDHGAANESQVSKQQLQQFVAALGEVRSIRTEYMPKVQQAESQQQQNDYKRQAQKEMVAAIRGSGLEIEEYNRIGRRVQGDQRLANRVKDMMQPDDGGGAETR